jgi:hypothetical protein
MEVERKTDGGRAEKSKRAIIVDAWRRLREPAVGADEIEKIQTSLDHAFGASVPMSPAAIARVLADEGADLRHPEIIECDVRWRESQIEIEAGKFSGVAALAGDQPLRLDQAEALIRELEKLRIEFDRVADLEASEHIRMLAADARKMANSRAANQSLAESARVEQNEIAEWLRIWLQTPNLFESWLDLRKSSPDFKRTFTL